MVTGANRSPFHGSRSPELTLLRDCFSLGELPPARPSAVERLEEAVGRELAHRLLSSLTANGHR